MAMSCLKYQRGWSSVVIFVIALYTVIWGWLASIVNERYGLEYLIKPVCCLVAIEFGRVD